MKLAKALKVLNAINVVLLIAAACWMRLSSLEDMPAHLGDESFYANQAARLLDGRSISIWTTSGNLLDPFFAVLEIPLLLLFKPSVWALRVPSALCGLLAVVGVYVLGRRIFDRTTALIAATFLAALPVAIVFSRIGCEFSQTPLFDLFALYFAFRGKGKQTLAAYVVCLIVHPTNIFLLPVVLCVYLTQALIKANGDRRVQRTLLLRTATLSLAAVVALGIITFRRPASHQYYSQNFKSHDWFQFGISYGKLFFCQWPRDPAGVSWTATLRPFDWFYFTAAFMAFAFGTYRMAMRRQWDRVALLVGLLASVAGLHVVTGSLVLKDPTYRYGAFLIMPSVLALACVLQALLVEPSGERRTVTRQVQLAAIVTAAWPFLWIVQWNWFDYFTSGGKESLWTFRMDRPEASKQLLAFILRDAGRHKIPSANTVGFADATRTGRPMIIAQDWWTYPQMEYLARPRREVRVRFAKEELLAQDVNALRGLQTSLWQGAYVTSHANSAGEWTVRSLFPVGSLRGWSVPDQDGHRFLTAHRLNSAIPVPADYDGDGKADLALYRPATTEWVVRRSADERDETRTLGTSGAGLPSPGDFRGLGRAERAVYQLATGGWSLDPATTLTADSPVRIPAPADFDGDGRTDPATYRPDTVEWTIPLSGGSTRVESFGHPGRCLPVPGDFDGDGKADFAVYDFSTNAFLIRSSRDGSGHEAIFGGTEELIPVARDYDGDGTAEPAVFRPATAEWLIHRSSGRSDTITFGAPRQEIPVPADYDGDGMADLATFNPASGAWHIRTSEGSREFAATWNPGHTQGVTRAAARSTGDETHRR